MEKYEEIWIVRTIKCGKINIPNTSAIVEKLFTKICHKLDQRLYSLSNIWQPLGWVYFSLES